MKKCAVLLGAVLVLLLASACTTSPDSSPTLEPTSKPNSGVAASSAPNDQCTPVAGGIPAQVPDFDCLNLSSVSGSDATGELAWLGTDPFTLVTTVRDSKLSFSSKTPCNTLMSSATVTDTQFIVDPQMAMTMMACKSTQSDYEGWVVKFFSSPLNYTLNADSLVLSNTEGTVTFKAAGS